MSANSPKASRDRPRRQSVSFAGRRIADLPSVSNGSLCPFAGVDQAADEATANIHAISTAKAPIVSTVSPTNHQRVRRSRRIGRWASVANSRARIMAQPFCLNALEERVPSSPQVLCRR